MKRQLMFTAAQLAPELDGPAATLPKALDAISDAAAAGSDLIAFPEVFLSGYPFYCLHIDAQTARPLKAGYLRKGVSMDGPEIAALAKAAQDHGTHIVMGLSERAGDTLFNTQAFFGPSGLLGQRRKVMPTHHERMVRGMGDGRDFPLYDTDIGRLAATLWTTQITRANALSKQIVAGHIKVKAQPDLDAGTGLSLPVEPAGASGYGTEFGVAALDSYSRRQAVEYLGYGM